MPTNGLDVSIKTAFYEKNKRGNAHGKQGGKELKPLTYSNQFWSSIGLLLWACR